MREFNYKKVLVILSVLLVVQVIIYIITSAIINSGKEEMKEVVTTQISAEEESEILKKLDVAYVSKTEEIINPADLHYNYNYNEKFKCVVSMVDFQKSLYNLVNEGFPFIYNETNGKNKEEVSNFYKTDYAKINACGIMDEENYGYIAKELHDQIYKGGNTFELIEMDYDSIKQNQNGYMTVNFKVQYTASATINITALLAEREGVSPKIKFRSNSDLKKLFEKYKGEIIVNDFTESIQTLAKQFSKIKGDTTMQSINYRKEYYRKNAEKFNKSGIATENDFMNLVRAINDETLINDNFYNCEIKLDSIKELSNKYEVNVNLIFAGGQEINLIVIMYKTKNETGRLIEFKSSLYNENYNDTNAE